MLNGDYCQVTFVALVCNYFLYFAISKLGSVVNNPSANAADVCSIPELGRYPGDGNGNPLQYSCLENSMDRGAWQAIVHGVTKSQT